MIRLPPFFNLFRRAADTPAARARAAAESFAAAIRAGQRPSPPEASVAEHLAILRDLCTAHRIEVAKLYAGHDSLPSQRFAALDDLRRLTLHAPEARDPTRPELTLRERGPDYHIVPHPGARTALVVFTGVANMFGGPLRLIHRWFQQLDVSIIYLRDTERYFYTGGLRGLGRDFGQTGMTLRRLVDGLGVRDCVVVGNSGGGFGAILHASRLEARRCLAFSPPTQLQESLPALRAKVPQIDRLIGPDGNVALRHLLGTAPSRTEYRVIYPARHDRDRMAAQALAGLDGVQLCPVPRAAEHNLIPRLAASGDFARHLDWLVAP